MTDLRAAAERIVSAMDRGGYVSVHGFAEDAEACARALLAMMENSYKFGVCELCGQGDHLKLAQEAGENR